MLFILSVSKRKYFLFIPDDEASHHEFAESSLFIPREESIRVLNTPK